MGRSRHDDECDDRDFTPRGFEPVIKSCKGFDKHIDTLVPVLVSTCSEKVECIIEIKVVVAIEMTSYKVIDDIFLDGMQILEFVHGLEFDDVEPIRQNSIRLSLQQMFALVGGDVTDCGEDIGGMCSSAFYAISVIDSSFAGFVIDIKVLEIVVEVH